MKRIRHSSERYDSGRGALYLNVQSDKVIMIWEAVQSTTVAASALTAPVAQVPVVNTETKGIFPAQLIMRPDGATLSDTSHKAPSEG